MSHLVSQNWQLCLEHFKNPQLWTYIFHGLNNNIEFKGINRGLCTDIHNVPSAYTTRFPNVTYDYGDNNDDFREQLLEELQDCYDSDDEFNTEYELRGKFFSFPKIWRDIDLYRPIGECHTWNVTFGWCLAKLTFPHHNWRIISNSKHSSVVNQMGQYFDTMISDSSITKFFKDEPTKMYDCPEDCDWLKFDNCVTKYDSLSNTILIETSNKKYDIHF